jgi:hypothetical protein
MSTGFPFAKLLAGSLENMLPLAPAAGVQSLSDAIHQSQLNALKLATQV